MLDQQKCTHRRAVKDLYNPRGPDGQGRNRLRLEVLQPAAPERCLLRPTDLRACWEGIERPWAAEPTRFRVCDGSNEAECPRATHVSHYGPQIALRPGEGDTYWILNRRVGGFSQSGFVVSLETAAKIFASVAKRFRISKGSDETGEYLEAS